MKKGRLFLIAIPLLLLIPGEVYACRCGRPNVEWAFEKPAVIFSGEVVKLDLLPLPPLRSRSVEGRADRRDRFADRGAEDSSGRIVVNTCDFRYSLGEKYLVYASGSGNELKASVARTRRLEAAADDIRVLERLKSARDERKQRASSDTRNLTKPCS